MPTKDEIRSRYGISEDDFHILTQKELPSSELLLKNEAFIEKKGFWDGFEVWLKKTIVGGIILAVIFIGELSDGIQAIQKIGYVIYSSRENVANYASHFAQYAKDSAKGFLVHTETPPTEEDKKHQEWTIFPTGSQVYPVTGSWTPS